MIVNYKLNDGIILFSTHIISFFEWIVFFFAASSDSRNDNVILFQWYYCDFFRILQFFEITIHTLSNRDWKKHGILHFFKYQFCLIKNKSNMFDKNNHYNVSIFQQIKFFDRKKTLWFNNNSTRTYVLLIFAMCTFLFFSNQWFGQSKILFFAFGLYVFSQWNVYVNDDVNIWLKFSNFSK